MKGSEGQRSLSNKTKMTSKLSIISLRQTVSWFAKKDNLPPHMRHVGQRILEFIQDSMCAGLVPDAQEEDLLVVSGLAERKTVDRCSPQDIFLPRRELLELTDYYRSQFFARTDLRETVASTFSFVHSMLQKGVGDGEHDWKILNQIHL